jgi:hypothetical protein
MLPLSLQPLNPLLRCQPLSLPPMLLRDLGLQAGRLALW